MSVNDVLATRTVIVRFPDGNTQYWLTDRVFTPGEKLYLDRDWRVSDVLAPSETNGYTAVTVQSSDEAAA